MCWYFYSAAVGRSYNTCVGSFFKQLESNLWTLTLLGLPSYDLLSQTRTLQRHNLLIFPCCFETCPTTQPAFYIKITFCLSYFIRAHRIESSACQTIYTFWFRTLRSTSAPRTIPGCDIDCGKMDSDKKSTAFPFKANVTITNFRHLWVDYEWAWAQHKDGKSNISSSNKRFFVCLSASSEDLTVEWNILLVNAIPSNPVQYCTLVMNVIQYEEQFDEA